MGERTTIIEAVRSQAEWCRRLGSPFTAGLLEAVADDVAAGGAFARSVEGWPREPVADALALRIAGALHAAVLRGDAPGLAEAYPRPGAPGRAEEAARAGAALVERDPEGFRAALQSPPQTNETGRALGLFPGLLAFAERVRRPFALLEIGASAGLNLLMDSFAYCTPSWRRGHGPVLIKGGWEGASPPLETPLRVTARSGCDQNPLNPAEPYDRTRLRAFVWPDQFERRARLDAALDLAAATPLRVEQAEAADWLETRLPTGGGARLVYHSVVWQYLSPRSRIRVEAAMKHAGERASVDAPLGWLRLEPGALLSGRDATRGHVLDLMVWPGREHRVLAEVDPHGRWVEWLDQPG